MPEPERTRRDDRRDPGLPLSPEVAALLEESAETLFERAPCGYLTTLMDGTIVRVNATFLGLTGYERDELVGRRTFVSLLTAGGRIYHETHYAPLLAMQGAVREIALDIVRAGGSRLPALVNATVEQDADGRPNLIRVTVFDATHRREYERQLLQAREQERAARLRVERLQRVSGGLAGAQTAEHVAQVLRSALSPSQAEAVLAALEDRSEPDGSPRDAEEDAFLTAVVAQCAVALERARLHAETARRLAHEHDVAQTLQHSLLGQAPLQDRRLAVEAFYRPAVRGLEVGGDWHDTFMLPGGLVGVVVGDVVGRGLSAASIMGQLRSAVRALAAAGFEPAALLERLDAFVESDEAARMATLVYAQLDLDAGRGLLASAGHPPPVLQEPDAPARVVWDGRSAPLGVYPVRTTRPQTEVEIRPGARLLLYTDGLVERRDGPLDLGLELLREEADRLRDAPLPELVPQLVQALLADEQSPDDVCLLAVQASSASGA